MSRPGAALARAAAEMIGTRFRLHGRSPHYGVDCIGLVGCALEATGRKPVLPMSYSLRNSLIDRHLAFAEMNRLEEINAPIEPGDVILVAPGPGQHHVLVAEDTRHFIHAHAGLRSVVRMPGPLAWPIERHWRLAPQQSKAR